MEQRIESQTISGNIYQTINIFNSTDTLLFGLQLPQIGRKYKTSDLLTYRYRVVPFNGRTGELNDLELWLQEDQCANPANPNQTLNISNTRIYAAPGGQGKSRLLQEACLRARTLGWRAGFLEVDTLRADTPQINTAVRQLIDVVVKPLPEQQLHETAPLRVLVVVDYVDTCPDVLVALLKQLNDRQELHWRVVGLARQASWDEGWLAELTREDFVPWPNQSAAQWPNANHGDIQVLKLEPLAEAQARIDAYKSAVEGFHAVIYPEPNLPDYPRPDYPRPARLTDPNATLFERPLIVQIVALAVVLGQDIEQLTDEHRILSFALNRELNYLKDTAVSLNLKLDPMGLGATQNNEPRPVEGLLTALVLGANPTDAAEAQKLCGQISDVATGDLIRLMNHAYPATRISGGRRHWTYLQPDLLAEHLLSAVRDVDYDKAVIALDAFPGFSDPAQGATMLNRLTGRTNRAADRNRLQQFVVGRFEYLRPKLPDVLLAQMEPLLTVLHLEQLEHLDEDLPAPDRTVKYRGVILALKQKLLASDGAKKNREFRLTQLGVALSAVGRRNEALSVTEEAVELTRALVQGNPDAFVPDLAFSLNNLSIRYSELSRRDEALRVCEESVELYRVLVQGNPDAFVPNLASSLSNLGGRYSELGCRDEALLACEESVELYRVLVQGNPDAFVPDLARSLNNLGIRYSELGRWDEALQVTEEAVKLRRDLARSNPDAFVPDLARSLNNLGGRYSKLGRRAEALQVCEEAVGLYRILVQGNPDAFVPELASSLNNLGIRYSELGRRDDALRVTEEAVGLHHP